jgi:hypothetical protein
MKIDVLLLKMSLLKYMSHVYGVWHNNVKAEIRTTQWHTDNYEETL